MLSTKTETYSGQLKNPFSNYLNPYQQYTMCLDNNLNYLKKRYPHEQSRKLKDLLEELDNNLEMVLQILQEEHGSEPIVAEKLDQPQRPIKEENKILKNAVASLYKKLLKQDREREELKESNERLRRENEQLRMKNKMLLDQEFSSEGICEDNSIF